MNLLLSNGAEISAKNNDEDTPLHMPLMNRYTEIAKDLIKAGSELNTKDDDAYTPLHLIAKRDNIEDVKILIAYNFRKNPQVQKPDFLEQPE